MWMIDYGATWIKFYKVEKNKSFQYVSPPTSRLFFYLLKRVLAEEGFKKNETVFLGFPGVVKDGVVLKAPNLDEKSWKNVRLAQRLEKMKITPYILNDADLHGRLVVKGKGVELVLAFGTGLGSSIYVDGVLVPNTEIGHHPFIKSKTYEQLLGQRAFNRLGRPEWIRNVKAALQTLQITFNPDKIYMTGGLSTHLAKQRLPKSVRVVGNPAPNKKVLKAALRSYEL